MSGTWDYQTNRVRSGSCGLLTAGGTEGETIAMNMAPCSTIGWSVWVKRGPSRPEIGDTFRVQWSDNQVWRDVLVLDGGADPELMRHRGTIDDPRAFWIGFQARLAGSGDALDNWFVDDFGVGCDPVDADEDGFWDGIEDCDPTDANRLDRLQLGGPPNLGALV